MLVVLFTVVSIIKHLVISVAYLVRILIIIRMKHNIRTTTDADYLFVKSPVFWSQIVEFYPCKYSFDRHYKR